MSDTDRKIAEALDDDDYAFLTKLEADRGLFQPSLLPHEQLCVISQLLSVALKVRIHTHPRASRCSSAAFGGSN